ncbi:MAG: hypothetical protein Q7K43_02900 [Candidatus Woesearchaeota archaeon]|nr:hypothetical protein [Candidatus Woesearchaeota archaeon]
MERYYFIELRNPTRRPEICNRLMSDVEYVAMLVNEATKKEDMEKIVEDYARFIEENTSSKFARNRAVENIAIVVCGLESEVEKQIQYELWNEVLEGDPRVLAQRTASILDILDWSFRGSLCLKMKSYDKK